MAKSAPPPPGDEQKKVADANWLMGDTSKSKPKPKPKPKPASAPPDPKPALEQDDHSYDLVGGEDELFGDADEVAPPVPVPVSRDASRKQKPQDEWDATDAPVTREHEDDEPAVGQIWTRGAEWGTHLFWVGLAAAAVLFLAYQALMAVKIFLAILILIVGGALVLALCYPIFITLERPVRITPEQAAKDYFAMLSYPFPFYPRMWLLLSTAGQAGPEFSSYGQFKTYWKRKLAAIQGGKAAFPNPLKFQVENFSSDKSVGQTTLMAKYTLKVFRGDPGPGNKELAAFQISTRLVKGPDRMWYLNSGTLPTERKEASNKSW